MPKQTAPYTGFMTLFHCRRVKSSEKLSVRNECFYAFTSKYFIFIIHLFEHRVIRYSFIRHFFCFTYILKILLLVALIVKYYNYFLIFYLPYVFKIWNEEYTESFFRMQKLLGQAALFT